MCKKLDLGGGRKTKWSKYLGESAVKTKRWALWYIQPLFDYNTTVLLLDSSIKVITWNTYITERIISVQRQCFRTWSFNHVIITYCFLLVQSHFLFITILYMYMYCFKLPFDKDSLLFHTSKSLLLYFYTNMILIIRNFTN